MAQGLTKTSNQIIPEVLAPMMQAQLEKKLRFASFAEVDSTLQGQPGDTLTFPAFVYSGDAQVVAEGEKIPTDILETKKRDGKHHGVFAYVVIEEHEWSFDDEDNKIEITAKVKFNSADGTINDLPKEWLNPSALAPVVEFEDMNAYEDSYENRTKKTTAGSSDLSM